LSLIMLGARNSLFVALAAVLVGVGIGLPLGLAAAAKRGTIDALAMRFNDLVFAFPAVLSAIMLAAVFGPGVGNAIFAIGIFNIPVFARVVRGAALVQWELPYILAARIAGKNAAEISFEHILPNIVGAVLAQSAIQFSTAIIAEAGLSYIGFGVQPPSPSWGRMLGEAQTLLDTAPHLAVFPGLAILLAVLGFHLAGEGINHRFDPRARERQS
jgi:peptide/nickel transport system permease protein